MGHKCAWFVLRIATSSAGGGRPAGGDVGGLPICLIKVAVLGFLLCEDGDLPEAGPS
jgi:hypothetical protein